jgi:hypothetical protein
MISAQKKGGRPWIAAIDPDTRKASRLPKSAGIYEWRVDHAFLPDLKVVFLAHMRMRGGCGDDFLFPSFDRWTGWNAVIPVSTEWREAIDAPAVEKGGYAGVTYEGADPEDCPFCGRTPSFEACETAGGSGIVVCGVPHRYDRWTLRCCGWAARASDRDPRTLIERRRSALTRFRIPA